MPNILIEACVTSVLSAINAEKGGARRVELCDNLIEGGTTPSRGTIALARKNLSIGLFVMIRPRGGDFCYSDLEFEIMKEDVKAARELGADGVVAGILLPDGKIDAERMAILIDLAGEMGFTCHRAFDMSVDIYNALEDLIGIGVDRILSSGGKNKAPEGKELIRQLIEKANGRILIMPGSGVNEETIVSLRDHTGAKEFHVTGRSLYPGEMIFRNPDVSMGDNITVPEYDQWITDPERINKIVELANS
ncbi:MAG: copper homeostasis protein CutC [Bacteroidetes bacterium]|nr:MAG: copper homeostasis protein CutC [Bacteroidota bacterium]